jgi:quercetin dioxygenase-like cupin family protein
MPVLPAPLAPTHHLPHASFTSLATPRSGARETALWRVRLEAGAEPTRHSVTREELFFVLSGCARVHFDAATLEASAGDVILIPAETPFALGCAGATDVELLCCLPVGGQARLPDGQLFTPPWAQ